MGKDLLPWSGPECGVAWCLIIHWKPLQCCPRLLTKVVCQFLLILPLYVNNPLLKTLRLWMWRQNPPWIDPLRVVAVKLYKIPNCYISDDWYTVIYIQIIKSHSVITTQHIALERRQLLRRQSTYRKNQNREGGYTPDQKNLMIGQSSKSYVMIG